MAYSRRLVVPMRSPQRRCFRAWPLYFPLRCSKSALGNLNFELQTCAPILRGVFAADQHALSATTRYCAVYGHPIIHSASPAMQNAGIATLGLDWRYLAFDVQPNDLAAAISGAKAMRFVGLNLTIPHKILALEMVDELDESAQRWGAVNTIRMEARNVASDWKPISQLAVEEIREVRTRGFNTDADAIVRALREDVGCELEGGSVLMLGAGGAGRTAALRLAAAGVKRLFLVNRTIGKAEEVADEIRKRFPATQVAVGYPSGSVDLLLNATALGLNTGDPLPFDPSQFRLGQAMAVYDMIYRPASTKLLQAAKAAGCRMANGMGMLLYQGAKALEIWSGQAAPLARMREALVKHLHGQQPSQLI